MSEQRASVYWDDQEVPVVFYDQEELPWWSMGAILGKVIDKDTVQSALQYLQSHFKWIEDMDGDTGVTHTLIEQMQIQDCLEALYKVNFLDDKGYDAIMDFMEQIPTPSRPPPAATKRPKDHDKGKEEDDEDGEWEPPRKRLDYDSDDHMPDEPVTNNNDHDGGGDEGRHFIDQIMVATRLMDSLYPLISDDALISGERDREDWQLFLRNLMRALPKQEILNFVTGEEGAEEDDSPVVTVGQRVQQLGYSIPMADTYEGRKIRLEIGTLATRYYRELNGQRDPPQLYRTLHGGKRMLVNKWTLNNCHNTLDRAIHTLLQL